MATSALRQSIKICQNCGRQMTWRKAWANNWDEIKYCSATCRRPLGTLDRDFEAAILSALREQRESQKSGAKVSLGINVDEVESAVLRELKEKREEDGAAQERKEPANTRERARRAARRLVDKQLVDIWQGGQIVDPSFAKGTMQVRLREAAAAE